MGIALPQQDLPFTQEGISPDVVSTHTFPSRMTVSQILETVGGKLRCFGVHVDGTPFANTFKIKTRLNLLTQHGFHSSGKELMMCGKTGEPLKSKIFAGLCFYQQRLHHMAREKCYSRKGGPVDAITMQPVAGRKVGGGIRLEMEKDCLNSVGCMTTLTERMQSIGHSSLQVCKKCSLPQQTCCCKNVPKKLCFCRMHQSF